MTNYSRSVLLSNGLHRPKIQLKKFDFSPIDTPANIAKSYRHNAVPNRFSSRFSTSRTNGPRLLSRAKAGTHRLRQQDRTQRLTRRNTGHFGWGAITTLGTFRTFTNIPGPGIRTASFAAFGAWSGVLPKNAGSLGTAMRSCASLFRGVAAPLGCVIQ